MSHIAIDSAYRSCYNSGMTNRLTIRSIIDHLAAFKPEDLVRISYQEGGDTMFLHPTTTCYVDNTGCFVSVETALDHYTKVYGSTARFWEGVEFTVEKA